MSKPPAFLLYASDFDMDTGSWTATQVGVYFRLLMHEWVNGPLPNSMAQLARIARVDVRNMAKMWSAEIAKKFTTDDAGMYVNKRMEDVRQEQLNYRERQRVKGIASADKRRLIPSTTVQPSIQPGGNSSISSSSLKKEKKKNKEPFSLPEWIPKEAWDGFVEFRKKGKAPFTNRARNLIIQELDNLRKSGNDPALVLDQSVKKGWTDVWKLKTNQGGNGSEPKSAAHTHTPYTQCPSCKREVLQDDLDGKHCIHCAPRKPLSEILSKIGRPIP